jgi:hypothetical protein
MTLLPQRDVDLRHLGGLVFNEKYHSYHNSDGEKYSGVTTLLSKYKSQKFNADNTAKYKAMKDFLPEKIFKRIKEMAGGWENAHTYYERVCNKGVSYLENLEKIKNGYLEQWKNKTISGSEEHDERERDIIENGFYYNGKLYPYLDKNILEITKDDVGVCTEILLWDHSKKLAGLADIVIFDKGKFYILDFKTNKEIKRTGFMGRNLLPPFDNLPECEFSIYSLQLNIYAYMINALSGCEYIDAHLISTKSEEYERPEDVYIECMDLREEVKTEIFNELF